MPHPTFRDPAGPPSALNGVALRMRNIVGGDEARLPFAPGSDQTRQASGFGSSDLMAMQLKRAFGKYPAGSVLWFAPATPEDALRPDDIVLCGLNNDDLFPHLVLPDGELTPFGYIVGQLCNIRYKAVAVDPIL